MISILPVLLSIKYEACINFKRHYVFGFLCFDNKDVK